MTSICFTCKHFKQTSPLDFVTPAGYCNWEAPALPHWLQIWVESNDKFYGPRKECSRLYPPLKCDTWEQAADDVIEKRKSEEWYD